MTTRSRERLRDALIRTAPEDVDLSSLLGPATHSADEFVQEIGEPAFFDDWVSAEEEHWVFALADGGAYLIRLAGEEMLEVRFLGALRGGEYTEWIGGGNVLVRFEHPRLSSPLSVAANSPAAVEQLASLRETLRAWAAEPPAP